jgi:hypothetical protein
LSPGGTGGEEDHHLAGPAIVSEEGVLESKQPLEVIWAGLHEKIHLVTELHWSICKLFQEKKKMPFHFLYTTLF